MAIQLRGTYLIEGKKKVRGFIAVLNEATEKRFHGLGDRALTNESIKDAYLHIVQKEIVNDKLGISLNEGDFENYNDYEEYIKDHGGVTPTQILVLNISVWETDGKSEKIIGHLC